MVGVATLSMTLYFVFVRPYKEENQQTTTVVDELILFVVILFFVYIYMKQDEMPIEDKKNLGWIIIFNYDLLDLEEPICPPILRVH